MILWIPLSFPHFVKKGNQYLTFANHKKLSWRPQGNKFMPWLGDILTIETALPKLGGSYALFLQLDDDRIIQIPRFGEIRFPSGTYIYSGSANGSGGLKARVLRHFRSNKRKHWHIDWFRPHAQLVGVYYQIASGIEECVWSKTLAGHPGASVIIPGFGSSDCNQACPSHLIQFDHDFSITALLSLISR